MKKRTQHGFTLIELIITMALVAVILGLGVPAFVDFVKNNRMISVTNDLVSSLQVARSEAIKLNGPVTMCISSNGSACTGGTTWESGWIVFSDPNVNSAVEGATIDRARGGVDTTNTIRVTAGANVASSITFNGNGLPRDVNNNIQTATFSICDDRGTGAGTNATARAVIIGATGRVRSTDTQGNIICP